MYHASILTMSTEGISDAEPSYDIPLLRYADEIMFFIEGLVDEARNLSILLDLFVNFSGLQINHTKSAFVGFGQTHNEGIQCSEALGTPW